MNYIEGDFVVNELKKINKKSLDISINWKTKHFEPQSMFSSRIAASIDNWSNNLERDFKSQDVEFSLIVDFKFLWHHDDKPKMIAIDDRGKTYEKYIAKS